MATRSGMTKLPDGRIILFDKYEIGRLVGIGGFSRVYHAREIQTGKSVAVKKMSREKIISLGLGVQVKREVSIMSRLRHPNIARLFEVLASKTHFYFIMEYVKGGRLSDKIEKIGRLSENTARRYFQQTISAVLFCHTWGIVHRDLKLENILLDEHNNVKIIDFGFSTFMDQFQKHKLMNTFLGTPAYVAPEILCNNGYHGPKIDIWSCGVALFFLTAGYLPFEDPNLMELFRKVRNGNFKYPKKMSPELRHLISRFLCANPATRITGEEIMADPWFSKGGYQCAGYPCNFKDDEEGWWFKEEEETRRIKESSSSSETLIEEDFPVCLNAFHILSLYSGTDISGLLNFEKLKSPTQMRFASNMPASLIIGKFDELVRLSGFSLKKKNCRLHLEGPFGGVAVTVEIVCLKDTYLLVIVRKRPGGDSKAYEEFYLTKLLPAMKEMSSSPIKFLPNSNSDYLVV